MCGIVGCVLKSGSGFFKRQEDSFFELLFADQLRGEDSTGLIGVEKDTTFHIAKEASRAVDFIPTYKAHMISTLMWNSGKAYIGHNRKKTVGDINDEMAHPFAVGKTFAMVHNGTLFNWEKLVPNYKELGAKMDSQCLAIHFYDALNGAEDAAKAIETALGKVDGAYAVAMYDQVRHKVFLTRNKDRPLSIIETDDAWYFASEYLMATWVLTRPVLLTRYLFSNLKTTAIAEHELITFDLEKNKMERTQLSPKKPYQSGTTTYYPTYPTTQTGYGATPTNSGGQTGSNKRGVACTEPDFKRFRKEWLGKRITVRIDDVLEENYPDERLEYGNCDLLRMFATSDAIWWMHAITIPVKCKEFGIKASTDVLGKKWVIDVEDAVLSSTGTILIEGGDPKPVVSNVLLLKGNATNKEFRSQLAKLDYEELHAMAEEVKYGGASWQIASVNAEINWRDSTNTLEEASKKALQRGVVLTQVKKTGKFVYQDSEGNIYYETAIALQ